MESSDATQGGPDEAPPTTPAVGTRKVRPPVPAFPPEPRGAPPLPPSESGHAAPSGGRTGLSATLSEPIGWFRDSAEFFDLGLEPEYDDERANTWLVTQSMYWGGTLFCKAPARWNLAEEWRCTLAPDIIVRKSTNEIVN
eukprot:13023625-Alexandrium_andersonii.AAC.1